MRPHDPGKLSWWWGHAMWRKHLRRLPVRCRRNRSGRGKANGAEQRRRLWLLIHS